MSSGRGPATPVGIGVTGTSGVNTVVKSPYHSAFLLAWVRHPPPPRLRGGFLQGARSAYCACSLFLKRHCSKNFLSSSGLGNILRGFGGKVGNSWALGGTNGASGDRLKSESGG